MPAERRRRDALIAGVAAAAVSGIPSTIWTLRRGGDILDGARAAGRLLLPRERRTAPLLVAAVPVHLGVSVGWALALEGVLPRRHAPLLGALAGIGIAALDLAVIGRRIPAIRELEQVPQWLDHAAYGLTVGIVLRRRAAVRRK